MVALLRGAAFFVFCSITFLRTIDLLDIMYRDLRIRNANKPTAVPREYRAFVFCAPALDTTVYKIILAPSFVIAYQRLKDFNIEQGLDLFWSLVTDDDFEVIHRFDTPPALF